MKRLLLVLAVFASTAILLAPRTPDAYACSGSVDLVKDAPLIVAGRFTGWELDTSWQGTQVSDPEQTGGMIFAYAGIRATMQVDRVFKGSASGEITITSGNTVNVYDHEPKYVWVGPTGACGAFGEDPTGMYGIMGLGDNKDGSFGASIFSWFYSGEDPPTDYSDRRLSPLSALLPGSVPSSGGMPASQHDFPLPIALVLGPLAFLAGAAFLWRRGESHNG